MVGLATHASAPEPQEAQAPMTRPRTARRPPPVTLSALGLSRRPTVPARPLGLAPLRALHVELPSGEVVRWEFAPMPILAFERASPSERHKVPTTLWLAGGGYRVAWNAHGTPHLVTRQGPSGLERISVREARAAHPEAVERFRKGHGGEAPTRAVRATLRPFPAEPRYVGTVTALEYPDNKGESDPQGFVPRGRKAEYKHDIELPGARPFLVTNLAGDGLWLAGGSEAVVDGWLHDARPRGRRPRVPR